MTCFPDSESRNLNELDLISLRLARVRARALPDLLDREPHLLRSLAKQLLPPPLDAPSHSLPRKWGRVRVGAARLRIDLSSVRTVEDVRQALSAVLMAIAQGEITPAEGAHIAKRVSARLRAGRRPVGTPPG